MSDASVTITGLSRVQGNIDKAIANILLKADQAFQGAGIDTQAEAKINCPVDTGRLRASIQYVRLGPCQYEVNTNVWYAWEVELGTHRMKAQPYLFPAYLKGKRGLKAELGRIPGVKVVSWS